MMDDGLVLRWVLGKISLCLHFLNIYMMGMVEELERAQLGVKLEKWCVALICVDDIVLVADSGVWV